MKSDADRKVFPRHLIALAILLIGSSGALADSTTDASTRPADVAGVQKAEPAPRTIDSIRQWFADLAHADGSVRDAAMVNLMGLRREDLPDLRKVVEDNLPLAPAQAAVLRRIVIQVYLAGDAYDANPQSGFLGIRMAQTTVSLRDFNSGAAQGRPLSGVVVEVRMPGFCAGRMLRDGDIIIGIVERPHVALQSINDFAMAIQDVRPGQTVHFVVLRQGQLRRIPISPDPRPLEANENLGMPELLDRRHRESDNFWTREFAPLIKEGVS